MRRWRSRTCARGPSESCGPNRNRIKLLLRLSSDTEAIPCGSNEQACQRRFWGCHNGQRISGDYLLYGPLGEFLQRVKRCVSGWSMDPWDCKASASSIAISRFTVSLSCFPCPPASTFQFSGRLLISSYFFHLGRQTCQFSLALNNNLDSN